jgi:DNA polymerase/3'-5' exonuclease PolX
MSGGTRFPAAVAGPIARRFAEMIAPYCHQVVIAGSLRRRLPTVGDIEIVAVPMLSEARSVDMFGELVKARTTDHLHDYLESLLTDGIVQKRPRSDGATFWGPKAKYMTFEGIPLDLFTPDADRIGIILAIRTGPAEFSHRLVTPKDQSVVVGRKANGHEIRRPGLMPPMYRVQDGWLTYRVSGERIPTPTEESVFQALGLPWAEPWQRG